MRVRTSWIVIALIPALGCGLKQIRDGQGPRSGAGGSAPVRPMQHTPMTPPVTRPDAGMFAGAAAAGSGGTGAKPMPPPNFALDCSDPPPSDVPDDPLAAWEAERDEYGALGHPATFELEGAAFRVHGAGVADLEAPFTLHTGKSGSGLVSFADAEVEDVAERGKLELYGGGGEPRRIEASGGAIEGLPLKTVVVEDGMLEGTIGLVDERVGNTHFYRANAAVSDLALEEVRQAYLYPEGTSGLEERIEWIPTGPVVVREASSLTFFEAESGSVGKATSEPLDLDYEAFSVAGDFSAGSLDMEDREVRGTPVAIFGRAARLRVGASAIEARDGFRLTQAVNEAGLVLPAAVEIVPETAEVWVRPNETRVVRLHYRESSFGGDAVLGEIKIGGRAKELLELQTGFPPTLTGEIIEAVIDTGWAAPLAAIATLPTVSVVFVIDVFGCIFGGCANLPAPLDPFPQWMDAGAIGTMEVRVKGNLGVGTYETSLTFVGRNFCAVTVPLTVHIGEPPPAPADAGADASDAAPADGG